MLEIICIDDTHRPNEVPTSRWVKKGEKYTLVKIMKVQGGVTGCKLAEINNDDLFPYTYFRLTRFGVTQEEVDRLVQAKELEVEYI